MPVKKQTKYTKVKGKKDTYSYKTKGSAANAFGVVRVAKALTGQSTAPKKKTLKVDGYTGAAKKTATRKKKK